MKEKKSHICGGNLSMRRKQEKGRERETECVCSFTVEKSSMSVNILLYNIY